jgi:hypothetical protein
MAATVGSVLGLGSYLWDRCKAAVEDFVHTAFVGPDQSETTQVRQEPHQPTAEELSQDALWRESLNGW